MARGINKVILVATLGQDPETRYTQAGKAITSISAATSTTWKDKQTGKQHEETEWHKITFFNRLAEIAGEYLRKGSKIYVEGRLKTDKWKDNNGVERYTTGVIASEMQMLDSRGGEGGGQQAAPPQQARPQPQSQAQQPQQHAPAPPQGMDDFSDDIMF